MANYADGRPTNITGLHPHGVELAHLRGQRHKVFDTGDGALQFVLRGKPWHWQRDGGEWDEIAPAFGPASVRGYDLASGPNRFQVYANTRYGVRWPIMTRVGNHYLPQKIVALAHLNADTKDVTILATAAPALGVVSGATITYQDVFPGVHLSLTVDHQYSREVVTITEAAKATLRQAIVSRGLDAGYLVLATALDLDDLLMDFPLAADSESVGRLRFAAEQWFPAARAWDAAGAETVCRWRFVRHPTYGPLLLTGVSLAWLNQSTGAVTIDPDTYYGNTGDGEIYGNSATYTTARSTSYDCLDIAETIRVGQDYYGSYDVYRGYLSFETGGLDGYNVAAAELYLYIGFDNSATDFDLRVYNDNAISLPLCSDREANYDRTGTIQQSSFWNTSAWSSAAYVHNAMNTAHLNLNGDTRYLLRSARDVNINQPAGQEFIHIYSSNVAGTATDPYMLITVSNDYVFVV